MDKQLKKLKDQIEKLTDKNRFRLDFSSRNRDYEDGYRTAIKDILKLIKEEIND